MNKKITFDEMIGKAIDHQRRGQTEKAHSLLSEGPGLGWSRKRINKELLQRIHDTVNSSDGEQECAYVPNIVDHLSKSAEQILTRSRQIVSGLAPDHPLRDEIHLLESEIAVLNHEINISMERGQFESNSQRNYLDTSSLAKLNESWLEDISSRAVSQLGQDLWVLERSSYKRGGFFVEFGATNGVLLSNTFLLEKEFGWDGICAEPNPGFFEKLQQNRLCTVSDQCIGPRSGEIVEFVFADVYGGMVRDINKDYHGDKRKSYSETGETKYLTTISLHDFLLEHNAPTTIDYLSIDTEGSEVDILEAFPFESWNIRNVTVEHNFTESREAIRKIFDSHGYRVKEAQWDDWYFLDNP